MPAFPTHAFVFFIAAYLYLRALGDHLTVTAEASIDDGFLSAFADRFYLAYTVGKLKKTLNSAVLAVLLRYIVTASEV